MRDADGRSAVAVDEAEAALAVAPDDRVIINGLMRARAGAKVTPQEQGAPAPPAAGPQAKS